MIETADDGAGSAVAQYWLLLLHLKKNDLAASQVDYQHTVLFMNSFGTLSPLYNKLAKLIVCCGLHLFLFFSFLFSPFRTFCGKQSAMEMAGWICFIMRLQKMAKYPQ